MMKEMKVATPEGTKSFPLWSRSSLRLRIVVMICFAVFAQGLMTTDFNMAIVCMVNHTATVNDSVGVSETETGGKSCPKDDVSTQTSSSSGNLQWSNKEQSWIFSSFYVGGLLSVLACAFGLANRFGLSRVIVVGAIVSVVGSFLTPLAAEHGGVVFTLIVRFIMGSGQGVMLPCAAAMVTRWFPVTERSTACAIYTAGNQLSQIAAMFFSAQLCQTTFLNGWPSIFYTFGIVGAVFCILWLFIVSDSPDDCQSISEEEKIYISNNRTSSPTNPSVPWKAMLTSTVVLSTYSCTFAYAFVWVALITYLPLYFHTVMKMNLTSNGIMSALPFVAMLISKIVMGLIADLLKKKTSISVNAITRVSNTFASFACGACMLGLAFLDCSQRALAVALFCLGMWSMSGYIPGHFTSLVSIAPPYSAVVNSLSRTVAQIASMIAPFIVAAITHKRLASEWQIVFILLAAILFVSGLFFLICGSASVEEWAQVKPIKPVAEELRFESLASIE
uniref:Major facilitator superfamily (MFS) profile domain-containing protein n=1 Tax=Plectus sambesii TaxID=2011161 RepID=A0A914XF85_9BILA